VINVAFGFSALVIITLIWALVSQNKNHMKHVEGILEIHHSNYVQWDDERQNLLDRIQAPSFAEYKHQEVKVIKAQTGEKEPPKVEQL
jgi:hypothetical protein